ncbi:NTPase [Archaeoglobus veneficus]|uniref:Nucleoside-triphosphatase Arcve_0583 n=1 Tax=Archaeoglobus veneficus (strain DSM 11195 / SNP6) TaxID=693661 RepID=F2KQP2_ARCVS|nr:NTPase [Archaeoglobus veneficus]AEA46604.1 Nucleoside-triphosphatase [Archaeoglobus veneficus SNP6]
MLRIAVTGRPGIGKTTFCLRVYEKLKDTLDITGFITVEVRERGKRVGFRLRDLRTGEEAWLARVGLPGPAVGKYGVDVAAVESFASKLKCDCELVILDEVGPMELKSGAFIKAVEELINAPVCCLFSIHLKARHRLLERIRREFKVITLDESNRDALVDDVAGRLIDACKGR